MDPKEASGGSLHDPDIVDFTKNGVKSIIMKHWETPDEGQTSVSNEPSGTSSSVASTSTAIPTGNQEKGGTKRKAEQPLEVPGPKKTTPLGVHGDVEGYHCRCCCRCFQNKQAVEPKGLSGNKQAEAVEPEGTSENKHEDLLTKLGSTVVATSHLADSEEDGGTVIDDTGPITKTWMLGALKLMWAESEEHVGKIAASLCERITMSLTSMGARQEKLFDAVGLNAVVMSMAANICIFCDQYGKPGTRDFTGPELWNHFREVHFRPKNAADEIEFEDDELEDIVPGVIPGLENVDDLDEVRRRLGLVRNFLINDLRNECHHCREPFDFDLPWQWSPGLKKYDYTALWNTHRYWCPILKRLGSDEYPQDLNRLGELNKTIRMPGELTQAKLKPLDQAVVDMYRCYMRSLAGLGREVEKR